MSNNLYSTEQPIEVIAGHTLDIPYKIFLSDGKPVNLNIPRTIIKWLLCPYEYQDAPVVIKSTENLSILVDTDNPNEITVHLDATDTKDLSGLFLYQIEFTDPRNIISRPLEGSILFRKRIHPIQL